VGADGDAGAGVDVSVALMYVDGKTSTMVEVKHTTSKITSLTTATLTNAAFKSSR
jgi:hypothetical protein